MFLHLQTSSTNIFSPLLSSSFVVFPTKRGKIQVSTETRAENYCKLKQNTAATLKHRGRKRLQKLVWFAVKLCVILQCCTDSLKSHLKSSSHTPHFPAESKSGQVGDVFSEIVTQTYLLWKRLSGQGCSRCRGRKKPPRKMMFRVWKWKRIKHTCVYICCCFPRERYEDGGATVGFGSREDAAGAS